MSKPRNKAVNHSDSDCIYNLDNMRTAVLADVHLKPKNQTKEEFLLWIKSKKVC